MWGGVESGFRGIAFRSKTKKEKVSSIIAQKSFLQIY
jgi:hypothetical protein